MDVGGTFTDVLLINEDNGELFSAKVPSTPMDSSVGVLNGIDKVCRAARINANDVSKVMHGTTVATNTVLTGTGAKVGLIVTKGYRQILQIARSFVPGGLGAWVIYNKSEPMAPLELTAEVDERIGSDGTVVIPFNEDAFEKAVNELKNEGIEALTICLINSFANQEHELKAKVLAENMLPGVPVSISSEVIPEMQEYERAITTVANSYVRPKVQYYIDNLAAELADRMGDVKLDILRSDGGLSSAVNASNFPVNLLMSGPAGGVTGAMWVAANAGFNNLLTLDMGGTSTDVALIEGGNARLRRETTVGDVTVKAPSVDIRTVGAGGGSVVHVPELTGALRVGPQSAGAEPGPAGYGKGGIEPTVTDANIVLGYLPASAQLGGDLKLSLDAAKNALKEVSDALDLSVERAAEGVYNIVNENMFGALRLVSVEQGYDPRDFALIAFGGAGPLHANALGKLMGSWPVIIPPGPGVLCAYGDATTRTREEASRTMIRSVESLESEELEEIFYDLARIASLRFSEDERDSTESSFQADLRYEGQGLTLPVEITIEELGSDLAFLKDKFDSVHEQLFTFSLTQNVEIVNLRAVLQGPQPQVKQVDDTPTLSDEVDEYGTQLITYDGKQTNARLIDRSKLQSGARISGPAIITEMDSTTLVLPGFDALVDSYLNILINPSED